MGRRRAVDYDCAVRDVLDRIGDAWSVLVILELSKGPCRFNALRRVIDAISQRMLSVTLRNLERDGLVARQVLDLSPPQVEYSLTARGHSLHAAIGQLAQWAEHNQPGIRASRASYDAREAVTS
ncbi:MULTISPECIES: winged helix-turn-helix transcriptional regulator [unclassified Epibacterium]|uniref:winged helix-turn-helix transcriptional regulator n=1 Tax=unclassified Epibacterium TaxID=2639179 RepID=UPI001EF667F0|nr:MULTISPECIES: helix-turn-helix domain-containing protein [unclassified Epibacterium]MCG7622464.1 helix-turn-helix transcriptional regulator [Epibacterium sp. Ofav1-8]MCG7628434.1 helix-turn-helix transcriptional regulator [Epibacterium sp. MM17-32]